MPRKALNAVSSIVTVGISATVLLSGCTHSGEMVFSRQNKVASALATMSMEAEAKNSPNIEMIYAAEDQLHAACAPLRDVASQRMSGETVAMDAELVAFISLDRCSVETRRVESLILNGDPAVARIYLGNAAAR